tara:strand:+ start:979 stop:1305 length:327 start_codon:yes stop_codon:yes gene_type:complete
MADDTKTDPAVTPVPAEPVRDTGPLTSKKFLAYALAELSSKFLIGMGLWVLKDNLTDGAHGLWWWMITLTVCTVFLEVGTILGIAYVDKFVRVAQITVGAGRKQDPEA